MQLSRATLEPLFQGGPDGTLLWKAASKTRDSQELGNVANGII